MKTLEELQQFYGSTLLQQLSLLENMRSKLVARLAVAAAIIAATVLIALLVVFRTAPMPVLIFAAVAGIVLFTFVASILSRGYVREFKTRIIGKLVKFLDENLNYIPHGCIPKSKFVASEIFKTRPNRYKGDDLVRGKLGATEIEFSELNAVYESGSGKNRSRRTVFKGLFFIADFNKNFTCRVVVLPDTAEKLFGGFGKLLQSWNLARDELIKLEDPRFERYFVVYGNDQIQARYILSTSLMERIADFREKTGRRIYLSFVGSKVFVAVPYTKNLFEPKIFRSVLDFDTVQEYFEDLQLAAGIVDDLNLNTRIWTNLNLNTRIWTKQ